MNYSLEPRKLSCGTSAFVDRYDSWDEWLANIPGTPSYANRMLQYDKEWGTPKEEFAHVKTGAEAYTIAREGWPKALEGLRLGEEGRIPAPMVPRRRRTWREDGDEFSLSKLYSGTLRCWQKAIKVEEETEACVTLVYDAVKSCVFSEEEFLKTLRELLALVDKLEASGRRVELFCAFCLDGDCARMEGGWKAEDHLTFVKVKGFQDPINLAALSAIGHPAMVRILTFRHVSGKPMRAPASYGFPYASFTREKVRMNKKVTEAFGREDVLVLCNQEDIKAAALQKTEE